MGACSVPSSPRFCYEFRHFVRESVRESAALSEGAMVSASSALTGAARHAAPLWLLRPMAGTHLRLPRGALPRRVDAVRIEAVVFVPGGGWGAAPSARERDAPRGRARAPQRVARCAGRGARRRGRRRRHRLLRVGSAGEVARAEARAGVVAPRARGHAHPARCAQAPSHRCDISRRRHGRARGALVWGHIGFQPQTQVPILVACLGFDAVTSDGDD